MADIDIDPFSDHKTDAQPDETGKIIPVNPEGVEGGGTWEPECKQETSFGGTSIFSLFKYHIEELCQMLSEDLDQDPGDLHLYNFELRNGELYTPNDQEGHAKISW